MHTASEGYSPSTHEAHTTAYHGSCCTSLCVRRPIGASVWQSLLVSLRGLLQWPEEDVAWPGPALDHYRSRMEAWAVRAQRWTVAFANSPEVCWL